VRHARETNFDKSLAGDESWFYYDYSHDSASLSSRGALLTRAPKKTESKKRMKSKIWSMSGIHSLLALTAGVRYNTKFFCPSVLADIERSLCDGKLRKTVRGIHLHLDNVRAHNAKQWRQEIA
jgi:hypothetical protein